MKKYTFFLAFVFIVHLGWTQNEKKQKVTTKVKSAIIYLDGAEIHRSKQVTLAKGRNKIIFKGLSPKLNEQSIQVTTTNNVVLLAISNKIDYITDVKEKPRVKRLRDSLELLTNSNIMLNDDKDAYKIEKDMLLQNKSIGGNDNGVSIIQLKQAADFYRSRIKNINNQVSKINKKVNKNTTTVNRINNELYQLNAKASYPRGEVELLLDASVATTTKINLKYVVGYAGWTPSYDIRAEDINKPIDLVYRAKVYNNTGIDWKNIKIKLSTGDPTISATQPKMSPWYLNYQQTYYKKSYKNQLSSSYKQKSAKQAPSVSQQGRIQNVQYEGNSGRVPVNVNTSNYEEIAVSELSAEFDIKKSYTIPSDNKPYIVDVVEYNLPTLYKHYAVPKLDKDAFLLARITNWQDLNLIEGTANIYFGGTYVGKSYISTRNISDTLDISLGRDKKVLVTRTKLKDFSEVKTIGINKKETHAYQMVVKNNRKVPIDITVLDQLPVSQHSDIEVVPVKISKANKNTLTGELKWNYTIAPGSNEKIALTFVVKYPKNKPIQVVKQKSKKLRKF